jgi:hypothetical protein
MDNTRPQIDFQRLLAGFNASTTPLDCGKMCAPFNPSGKPFCCDICHAVPVAYKPEWDYLNTHTDLWHLWRGDECSDEPVNPDDLLDETPEHLLLLSCKGPDQCAREFRATSCRQFPFFPYITSDFRFIGLAHDWEFESKCWILSHLEQVTSEYRQEFIRTFDFIFSYWMDDFDSYSALSEEVRERYQSIHKRIPLLHRNGSDYLISPKNEALKKISFNQLKAHHPYL